jgi:hypothetical protein
MPALLTEKTMYVSLDIETEAAAAVGSLRIMGANTCVAQVVWHTMEHSMGVMEMLRKPCLLSSERPSRRPSGSLADVGPPWGRRTWRIGWRRAE